MTYLIWRVCIQNSNIISRILNKVSDFLISAASDAHIHIKIVTLTLLASAHTPAFGITEKFQSPQSASHERGISKDTSRVQRDQQEVCMWPRSWQTPVAARDKCALQHSVLCQRASSVAVSPWGHLGSVQFWQGQNLICVMGGEAPFFLVDTAESVLVSWATG